MNTKRGHTVAPPDDRPPWLRGPTIAVFAGLLAIVVGVMVYVAQDSPEREVASREPAPESPPVRVPEPAPRSPKPAEVAPSPPSSRVRSEAQRAEPTQTPPESAAPTSAIVAQPLDPSDPAFLHDFPEPEPKASPPSVEGLRDETKPTSVVEEIIPSNVPEPATTQPMLPGNPTVPDKATIAAKTRELRQSFKAEYATRDPAVRAAFAQRLAREALATVDDPVGAWVLATEARDQAIQAGDYETFLSLGRFLREHYGVDTHDEDTVAFGKLPVNAGSSVTWYRGLIAEIAGRVDAMCDVDDFERATRYASVAKALATRAADASTAQEWSSRIKELGTLKVQFGGHKAAKETLQSDPSDRPANTKWGTYLCLIKGNFEDGLPCLVKGDDPDLAALAKREANPDRNAMETVAIADEWWTIGERSKAFRTHAWRHAGDLYEVASPELTGLAATKVEKRLEEIAATDAPRNPAASSLDQILIAQPWNVQWEDSVRHHGRPTPEGQNEWSRDEVITFSEGGRIDSRYFDRFEIRNGVVELHVPEDGDQPPFVGGAPARFRDRRRHGRAILVGEELRLIYGTMDRMDDPRNRGIGTRQQAAE